jgi:hypothetical protein
VIAADRVVVARLGRAIQYSQNADDQLQSSGIPGHPLSRVMTVNDGIPQSETNRPISLLSSFHP